MEDPVVDDGGPDEPDERQGDARPSQRIRIVGAEAGSEPEPGSGDPEDDRDAEGEAPSVTESDDPNKFGAIPVIPADGPPPPGMDDTEVAPTESAGSGDRGPAADDAPDPDDLELPHWTDPPSGQVPKVDPDEDLV